MSLAFGINFNHKVLIPNAADLKPQRLKPLLENFLRY